MKAVFIGSDLLLNSSLPPGRKGRERCCSLPFKFDPLPNQLELKPHTESHLVRSVVSRNRALNTLPLPDQPHPSLFSRVANLNSAVSRYNEYGFHAIPPGR